MVKCQYCKQEIKYESPAYLKSWILCQACNRSFKYGKLKTFLDNMDEMMEDESLKNINKLQLIKDIEKKGEISDYIIVNSKSGEIIAKFNYRINARDFLRKTLLKYHKSGNPTKLTILRLK